MGFLDKFRASGDQAVFQQTMQAPVSDPGQPRFAVVDVETTGLSAEQHRIVDIAVVTTDPWGRVLEEWGTRINPQGPVGATHIHGITDEDVADAPLFPDVIAQLNQRLAGAAIAAHHALFDLSFLRAEYLRAGWEIPAQPTLCTLQASEYHLPNLDRRRLTDCCWAVGTPLHDAHSAIGDARATAVLLAAYMHPHVGYPPLPEHLAMPEEALSVAWPASPTGQPRAATPSSPPRPARPPVPDRVRMVLLEKEAVAPVPALVELVERFSLVDALDEGAPSGTVAYLEKLAGVLEDGEVSAEEAADLASVADAEQLNDEDISSANQAFVQALAHAALDDGKVTRAERAELLAVSELLGVNQKIVPALLDRAEQARNKRLSGTLLPLPGGWAHGEPLRVGDKVVFTGCDDQFRSYLESKSESLGVRIIGNVSAKTSMLVTDGSMNGTKAAKAREVGTRVVHPDTYALMLGHLQPALAREMRALPKTPPAATPRHASGVEATPGQVVTDVPHLLPGPNPAMVRAWARANGFEVGTRGRLHQDIFDAFTATHPDV